MLREFWNGISRSDRLGVLAGMLALIGFSLIFGSGFIAPAPAAASPSLAMPVSASLAAPSVSTYTFYPTTALTGTTTVYSAVPRTISGVDVSRIGRWTEADVFVTGDVSGTETMTVTAQFSADGTNWVDAYQTYTANTLAQTTTTVTATQVTTVSLSSSTALAEALHQSVMSADGTDYFTLPMAGEYLRFKIEHSGSVTPTVRVSLRNP